ncbi:unnamed protein product [Ostreobium quekettii]|uniref:J domain-containing protein n=1 Tax=Ostreobium quekettii TaxID=121088 RepID=A0A8S1IXR2_9CHLO|nr:unnamed protein product [Ostreobium quekettii]
MLRPGMRPLRRSMDGGAVRVMGGATRLASGLASRGGRRHSRAPALVVASLCPYQTLGVSETADMNEIKRAYRKMALKHHPDREGGSESMFLAIHEAYEILLGTKQGKNMDRSTGWDFHDWYWKFLMRRKHGHKGPGQAHDDHHSGSASREQVRSQLAGLRHRAAVRAQRMRTEDGHSQHGRAHVGDEDTGTNDDEEMEWMGHIGEEDSSPESFWQEDDGTGGAPTESATEEGRQAYQRLCEEARRRQSLSGTENHQAVRSQLAGLKRRANIRKEMDFDS